MAENLLRTELLKQYSGNYTENYGEGVLRNGVGAMKLGPLPIYSTQSTEHIGLYNGEFKPNTRYLIDFGIDTDDIYYTAGGIQVPGGMSFKCTDNSSFYLYIAGSLSSPKGGQHIKIISPAGKTIKGMCPYYYISTPAFYRYDSTITEYIDSSISETGICSTGHLKENSNVFQLYNGGLTYSSNIIEI